LTLSGCDSKEEFPRSTRPDWICSDDIDESDRSISCSNRSKD
jgi:hypothetical protein